MNYLQASMLLLFFASISVPLASRLRMPLEIFLVIGSGLISLIPGLPELNINPNIVFDLFLPPILFSAAYFTSLRDLKINLRPITLLAFGLVGFTTVMVAIALKLVLPWLNWPECFLIGAIVSPSDASAATTAIKKLGMPRKLTTILEGESLINDASALILYRFSLLALITGSFSLTNAIAGFFIVVIGGIIVGALLSYIATHIIKKLNDPLAITTFSFITAFVSYNIAQELNVSGVISTVTAGLYLSRTFPESTSTQARMSTLASWRTLLFIVNGLVFALLGFELPTIMHALYLYTLTELIGIGLLVSALVIGLRLIWMFPAAYLPRKLIPAIGKRDPMPSWQALFLLGWTGMRGIVSLAAALALPYTLPNGDIFPHRNFIIFITYCVILTTLLLPTFTLPILLRRFKFELDENKMKEEATARIRAMQAVSQAMQVLRQEQKISLEIYNEFLTQIERRLRVIETHLSPQPYSLLSDDYLEYKKFSLIGLEKERETLIALRKSGEINDDVFHMLLQEVDIDEVRMRSLRA